MKIVVMAAGKGVRMQNLTKGRPKVLIEINKRPFLDHLLEIIRNSGFSDSDICIIVGYRKEQVIDFLKNRKMRCATIEQKEQLGTADAVRCAEDFVKRNNFVVMNADNIYGERDVKEMKKDDDFCYVAGFHHDDPRKFGAIVEKNGFLEKLVEKSDNPPSKIINIGLYKFTPEIFDAIRKIGKSPRGEYELTDAISLLAKKKKVKVVHAKTWLDFGKPEDVATVEEFLRKKK